MTIESIEHILLTGAGFTHNFGAPLAKEMWATIFNHKLVQNEPNIKKLMLENLDFESTYYSILEGSYSQQEKDAIVKAVTSAFENMDSIIRDYIFSRDAPYPVNIYKVQDLFNQFAGTYGSKKGFFFTLNQDLFVERKYYNGTRPNLPGIENKQEWFTTFFNRPLNQSDYWMLPTEKKLEETRQQFIEKGKFFYIKLHGSYNWISSFGERQMVIGRGKTEQIQKEPLLSWYFEIFKEVLFQPNHRLLVIGYGFNDEHVNHVIGKAAKDYGLKIFIISPSAPPDFQESLSKKPFAKEIWQGLSGYFPHKLVEIFPGDQSETQASRDIYNNFFYQ